MTRLTILGPQRKRPCVAGVLDDWEQSGPVAVVTAGWEERESETEELAAHIGRPIVNLELHARADRLYEEVPELLAALRERKDRQHRLLELYRLRLDHALDTVYELLSRANQNDLLQREAEDALAAVSALDARHVQRMHDEQVAFEEHHRPENHEAWAAAREEVAASLEGCEVLAIAGGHVRVLLDRLRLFGVHEQLRERDVVAWSAGAMAAMERVLLFHDSPPQGRGHAEVFSAGMALAPGMVALPHASTRLMLDDRQRLSVLARRLAPATCLCLEEGDRADWDGKAWDLGPTARWFDTEGELHGTPQQASAS